MVRQEIYSLQYCRGIAAMLVCLFHFIGMGQRYFGKTTATEIFFAGHSGVEFFFLLSGFIIYQAHRADFGQPEKLSRFAYKRAIRILPLFWIASVPLSIFYLTGDNKAFTFVNVVRDLFLIPREGRLILSPAWTLQHEVVFYTLFAFSLFHARAGIAIVAIWQTICFLNLIFRWTGDSYLLPANKFIGAHNLGFGIGLILSVLYDRQLFARYETVFRIGGVAALCALVLMYIAEAKNGPGLLGRGPALTLIYFVIYSFIIAALLSSGTKKWGVVHKPLLLLGSASYALYLTHEPVASIAGKIAVRLGVAQFVSPLLGYIAFVFIATAAAVAIHLLVEAPIARILSTKRAEPNRLIPIDGRLSDVQKY